MKHAMWIMRMDGNLVAPFVGAWIETTKSIRVYYQQRVAPFVGAWIETDNRHGRGQPAPVAPFVGAWIETGGTRWNCSHRRSLLS